MGGDHALVTGGCGTDKRKQTPSPMKASESIEIVLLKIFFYGLACGIWMPDCTWSPRSPFDPRERRIAAVARSVARQIVFGGSAVMSNAPDSTCRGPRPGARAKIHYRFLDCTVRSGRGLFDGGLTKFCCLKVLVVGT
jgi:hypothetical protein